MEGTRDGSHLPIEQLDGQAGSSGIFSSAVPQRSGLKSTSLGRLMRRALPLPVFAEGPWRCDARELVTRDRRKSKMVT